MTLIDHDLDQENQKDPLDLTLSPYEGVEVSICCPVCYQPLSQKTLDERNEDGGHIGNIYQLNCPNCVRRTHWGSEKGTAAAVKGWVK